MESFRFAIDLAVKDIFCLQKLALLVIFYIKAKFPFYFSKIFS